MEILLLLVRIFLAAVFAVAGVGKLFDLEGSERAVKEFGTPEEFAPFFARALPFAEIVFAVCLLFVESSWVGAIGAVILLLSFIGGMIWQLAQGNAPDCHCFGAIHSEPVSKKSLIRNVIFAILAFSLVLSGRGNQGLSLFDSSRNLEEGNFMSMLLGLATVGLLAAVVYYLKRIAEQQTQIMRRIEVLELTATIEGGRETAREALTNPSEGLPVGAPAPEFNLPDVNGKKVSLENLSARNKPTLFIFVSPNCNPCAALLPDIEGWQTEFKGKLNFVFVSSGKPKENLDKLAGATLKQILLQEKREVALAYGAPWTPTAVLVNQDGTIGSRPAAGDKAIRELMDSIRARIDDAEVLLIANGGELSADRLGEDLPEFFESDVNDKIVASQDLRGKRTLITFWSPTCSYCQQMLDELRDWERTKGADAPDLLIISEGEAETHRGLEMASPIILDPDRKISKQLGMNGTPSAILVSEDGKIVSETAVGAPNIWSLIGKRK